MSIFIKSLGIEYNGEVVVTDIDDCLIYTTKSIIKHGIQPKKFYFNDRVNELNKESVVENAELTDWGREFISLVTSGVITNFFLVTSAKKRLDILVYKFKLYNFLKKGSKRVVQESMSNAEKVAFCNNIKDKTIYVDDKIAVSVNVDNELVTCITYPKMDSRSQRVVKRQKRVMRRRNEKV